MSYTYRIIADYPIAAFPLNAGETTSFVDVSGNAVTSTIYGTPTTAPPLVTGGGQSYLFSNLNGFRFSTLVFTGTNASQDFSLEAWFKPIAVAGNIQVIGHDHANDGVTYDGESISFSTSHGAAGVAKCSWFPQDFERSFYTVGVHTAKMNQLYVNGVLRAQVDISEAQRTAGYTVPANPGILYVGHNITGTGSVLVDSVAVYNKSLTGSQIAQHFDWGTRVPDYRDVSALGGGNYWSFLDSDATLANENVFSDDSSWNTGQLMNAAIRGNILSPVFGGDNLTVAGQWMFSLPLAAIGATLGGSKIQWDGDGNFTVAISLNNETSWTPCVNGRELPGVGEGYIPGNEALTLRVSFPAGEPLGTLSRLRSLALKFYADRNPRPMRTTRTFDLVGAVSLADKFYQPLEMYDKMGADFSGGYAFVSADATEAPTTTSTIEMWVKPSPTAASSYIYDGRPGAGGYIWWAGTVWNYAGMTLYVNGQLATSGLANTIVNGQWSHLVMVLSAPSTTAFTIAARNSLNETLAMQVGAMTLYPQTFTAQDALLLFNTSLGIVTVSVTDTQSITIREAIGTGQPVKMYQYNWTIVNST